MLEKDLYSANNDFFAPKITCLKLKLTLLFLKGEVWAYYLILLDFILVLETRLQYIMHAMVVRLRPWSYLKNIQRFVMTICDERYLSLSMCNMFIFHLHIFFERMTLKSLKETSFVHFRFQWTTQVFKAILSLSFSLSSSLRSLRRSSECIYTPLKERQL